MHPHLSSYNYEENVRYFGTYVLLNFQNYKDNNWYKNDLTIAIVLHQHIPAISNYMLNYRGL